MERRNFFTVYPARWAGLRTNAPSALNTHFVWERKCLRNSVSSFLCCAPLNEPKLVRPGQTRNSLHIHRDFLLSQTALTIHKFGMTTSIRPHLPVFLALLSLVSASAFAADDSFVGNWK